MSSSKDTHFSSTFDPKKVDKKIAVKPVISLKCQQLHDAAVLQGESLYIDPETAYEVKTAVRHLARGHCCEHGCRHCPYGFWD